jgi:rare lipoprotein A
LHLQRSLLTLAFALLFAMPAAGQSAPPAYGYGAAASFRPGEPIDLRRSARPAPEALAETPDDPQDAGAEEEAETVPVSAPAPSDAARARLADETGVASWYGAAFAGRPTATGETFDPDAMTAAHPSLPLPSLIEVTNAENGRTAVVRVNDRGPFAHGRVLDVSRRAAEELGFLRAGQARVHIRYLGPAPRALPRDEPPPAPEAAPLTTAAAPRAAPPASAYVVQVGAFADPDNAERVRADLANAGPVFIEAGWVDGRELHRVRLAADSDAEAERLRQRVARLGYEDAIVQPR